MIEPLVRAEGLLAEGRPVQTGLAVDVAERLIGEGIPAFAPKTLALAQARLPNLAAKAVGRDIMTIERRS